MRRWAPRTLCAHAYTGSRISVPVHPAQTCIFTPHMHVRTPPPSPPHSSNGFFSHCTWCALLCVSGLRLRGGLPDEELAAQAAKIGKVAVTLTVTVPHIRLCLTHARTEREQDTHTRCYPFHYRAPRQLCLTHARTDARARAHAHTNVVALAVAMPHVRCVSRTNTHAHVCDSGLHRAPQYVPSSCSVRKQLQCAQGWIVKYHLIQLNAASAIISISLNVASAIISTSEYS